MNDAPPARVVPRRLGLFEGYGVEIEYMVVDSRALAVAPITDEFLKALAGRVVSACAQGPVTWSNELALHVVELKSSGPVADLLALPSAFQQAVSRAASTLEVMGARLLPTAMHPLMDPFRETRLWPHGDAEIYAAFDRIFDCRGHGWSNLQSVHLNLPFLDDDEFGRLHAATRAVLPLLPMLAASSPIVEGRVTGTLDNRLRFYRENCRRLPSVTGTVIPEPLFDQDSYGRGVYDAIRGELAPHAGAEELDPVWVNARGAIARFDRGSIEIRLLDSQECVQADIAILAATSALVRGLVEERWCTAKAQRALDTHALAAVLSQTIEGGSEAKLEPAPLLACLGLPSRTLSGRDLWRLVIERLLAEHLLVDDPGFVAPLELILQHGCLAQRLVTGLGREPAREAVVETYRELGDCLVDGRSFVPG